MCGIACHLAFPTADPARVRRMAAALGHRGPDGEGFHAEGPIALGHRRLAIIDLKGGAQPMFNEEWTLVVVFNGEIYNSRELADELRPRLAFRTSSDTEILLHLYEEQGERMVERLRGMFAFALWDAPRARLFAARDRFGEKPFLYASREGASGLELDFASELGALRASGTLLGEIDRAALSDFLDLLYIPAPRSIFTGVKKLPAGHLLLADAKGVESRRYWSPPVPGSRPSRSPTLTHDIREALSRAVRLRLRSDEPIAALLLDGLDSSTVVGLMAEELGPGVKTFSVGFGRSDDELPQARLVARRHRTDHREIVVTGDLAAETLEALSAYGEPFGDSSAVPAVAVCKAVAREVKVVLTGDGGDEFFTGYSRYRHGARIPHISHADRAARLAGRLGSRFRRAAFAAGTSGSQRNRALVEVFSLDERQRLLGEAARTLPEPLGPKDDVDAAIAFDLGIYLPDDLLVKTDTASMRWDLEARCPLLDEELAELVVPLAPDEKQSATGGKLSLRQAALDLLPSEILHREKRGFGSLVASWLQGPLRPLLEDLLRARKAKLRGWVEGREIDRVVDLAVQGRGNGHQAWALLALELWARGTPLASVLP